MPLPPRPKIYDIGLDGERWATQKDIDHLVAARRAYGKCRERGVVPDDIHRELTNTVIETDE